LPELVGYKAFIFGSWFVPVIGVVDPGLVLELGETKPDGDPGVIEFTMEFSGTPPKPSEI